MIGFNFYTEKTQEIATLGVKTIHFLADFVKELYDTAFLKIAEFETVDIGALNNKHYEAECKYWRATPDPERMEPSYEERAIVLTDAVRVFLVAFLSGKIAKETSSFAKNMKTLTIEQIGQQAGFIGRLGNLMETVQDKRYRIFTID